MRLSTTGIAALAIALAWPAGGNAAVKDLAQGKAAGAAGAEVIEWIVPWREGVELRYDAEDYAVEVDAGGRVATRTTGIETVRISEARADGYLQQWSFSDTRHEVLEGDSAEAAMVQGMLESLAELVLEVELDGAGNYAGIRNLAEVGERMRPVLKQAMVAGVEAATAAAGDKGTPVPGIEFADTMVERLTSPEVLAPLLSEDAVRYNDFVGVKLDEGRQYEVDVELDSPLGGGALPARITFGAYVRSSQPDDVFIEWTTHVDPEKAAEAAAALVGTLITEDVASAVREQVQELSVIDAGFVLFRRSTGTLEMLEATRTIRAAGELNVERRRMRLRDGDHDHDWADAGPPTAAGQPAGAG